VTESRLHKHEWVRQQLRDLALHELAPGDALPGERQLERTYDVSRITVRRAVSDLVSEGVLVRIHGKGTFVSHGRVRSDLHLASFNEDMRRAGYAPSTRVVETQARVPEAQVAAFLDLGAGEEAFLVKRVRLANGAPVSVDESWIPPRLAPDLLRREMTGSLYAHLAEAGHPVRMAEQTVEAAAATPEIASLLEIEPATPVLLFHRYTYTGTPEARVPVEYSISTYRSDRYQLSMRLGMDGA
jgi:GntR family transcriptional regulator